MKNLNGPILVLGAGVVVLLLALLVVRRRKPQVVTAVDPADAPDAKDEAAPK